MSLDSHIEIDGYKGAECSLEECPPGFFLYEGKVYFKSEYHSRSDQPDAYCPSGEYFWGGTKGDRAKRLELRVIPLELEL